MSLFATETSYVSGTKTATIATSMEIGIIIYTWVVSYTLRRVEACLDEGGTSIACPPLHSNEACL